MSTIYQNHDRVERFLTTDASGNDSQTTRKTTGIINAINYEPSGTPFTDLATVTVVETKTGITLFTGTITVGATAQAWYPSPQTHNPADGTANVDGLGVVTVADSELTITIASGGNAKTGTIHVHMR